MFVQIKCAFCGTPFDHDASGEALAVDCPHCGKTNSVAASAEAAKPMAIQRDAPNLSGAKPCPSCKTQIARDSVLCVHCGYNFSTRQKIADEGCCCPHKRLVAMVGIGLAAVAAAAAFLFWPEPDTSIPPLAPAAAPVAPVKPAPTAQSPVSSNAPAIAATPAPPAPPPGPTPEEIAAQKAEAERLAQEAEQARIEAERAAFEAKKAQAEQVLRRQLNEREPLYKINEPVELRRKNGLVDKGTLTSFSGTGIGRVALVATPIGEIGVPLEQLDPASRRRMDPDFREAFIAHMLSTRLPDVKPSEK